MTRIQRRSIVCTGYADRLRIPVNEGLLLAFSEEIVVQRTDQRAGSVAVHFPRLSFGHEIS